MKITFLCYLFLLTGHGLGNRGVEFRFPVESEFFLRVFQTGSGILSASYSIEQSYFLGGKSAGTWS
jgi:hypothetical protein